MSNTSQAHGESDSSKIDGAISGEAQGRKPLIAGNWKMNLNHLEAIAVTQKLAFLLNEKDYEASDIAVLPPFVDIRSVQTLIDGDRLQLLYGAQDLSPFPAGAYTGDISGAMLAKLGCTFVVVGHSERRAYHGESDTLINSKVKAALSAGLTPILCVGESDEIRSSQSHISHVTEQLNNALAGITPGQVKKIVIAYEPIWAIGTGKSATPEDAQEMAAALRARIVKLANSQVAASLRILYGGSVKASLIKEIMACPDVDGVLVGGASLDPEEFAKIAKFHKF
jgi:triosephosphate isomerase (TIM)